MGARGFHSFLMENGLGIDVKERDPEAEQSSMSSEEDETEYDTASMRAEEPAPSESDISNEIRAEGRRGASDTGGDDVPGVQSGNNEEGMPPNEEEIDRNNEGSPGIDNGHGHEKGSAGDVEMHLVPEENETGGATSEVVSLPPIKSHAAASRGRAQKRKATSPGPGLETRSKARKIESSGNKVSTSTLCSR